jgi:hypothetical protein
MEKLTKTIHDAATGLTWEEELTDEEIENLPKSVDNLSAE